MSIGGQGNINVNISGNAQGLVTAMNQAQTSTVKTMTTIQQQQTKTGSSTQSLAEKFSGNRGLIYSMGTIFGTITGVVAEMALLQEAQSSVSDATQKLTDLQARGMQGTQQYTQAQQQLEKAQRFERFTIRNLALAVTNFIPEILLLVTGLAKAKVASETVDKAVVGLTGAQKELATATVASNAAQKASNTVLATSIKPVTDLRLANVALKDAEIASGEAAVVAANTTKSALIKTGIGALIVAAGTALVAYIENWGKFRDKVNEAGAALLKFAPILKPILDLMAQFGHWLGQVLGNEAKTGAEQTNKAFKEIDKEAVKAAEDVQKAWEDTLNNLVDMTKKERMKELRDVLGFGKSGAKKIQLGIEIVQDEKELFAQLSKSLSLINKFKLNPKDVKPWAQNMIESLRDAMKDAGGKLDFLQGLVDVIKQNKDKGGAALRTAVASWFNKLPATMKAELAANGLDPNEIITGMGLDPATLKEPINTALGTGISDAIKQGFEFEGFDQGGGFGFGEGPGGGIVDSLIYSVKQNLTKEKLSEIGTIFTTAFVASITWADTNIKQIVIDFGIAVGKLFAPASMKDLGIHVGTAIATAVDWTVDTMTTLVTNFSTALEKALTPNNLTAVGTAIVTGISGAIDSAVNTTNTIGTGIAAFINGLLKGFTPKSLADVGSAVINGILDVANFPTDVLQKFFTGVESELLKLFNKSNLADVGTGLMSGIFQGAKAASDALTTFLDTVDQALHTTFSVKSMAAVGELLVTSILGAAKATGDALQKFLTTIETELGKLFSVQNLTTIASSLWDGIMGALSALPDLAGKLVVILKDAFTTAIDALIQAFVGEATPTKTAFEMPGGKTTKSGLGVDVGGGVKDTVDTRSVDTKNLDIFNRQIITITQSIAKLIAAYNLLARATVVIGADTQKVISINNSYARTVATITQDVDSEVKANNSLARTLVTVSKDVDAATKSNNSYARTVVTVTKDVGAWTKANNTLARTITEVSKDVGSAVKQMNTFARVLVQVGKDASSASKDVKSLASAINGLKSKTVTLTTVKKTVTQGANEVRNANANTNVNADRGNMTITIINQDEYGEAKKKKFKASMGKESYRFG